jgi:membrane protease YdiL (CAAX protease family)
MGPFGDQGFLGIAPFVPILIYMLLHLNYYEELYFRRNKKLVMLWAFLHIAMGVPLHVVIALLPAGFIYKYIYDKYGINNAFAAHFATNIFLVSSMLVSYAM